MQKGTIQNRDGFLNTLRTQLGRGKKEHVEKPQWNHNPQWEVLKGYSQDELVDVLKEQCTRIHTDILETDTDGLANALLHVIQEYQGKSVVTWDDPRFSEYQLTSFLENDLNKHEVKNHTWDVNAGEKNLEIAAIADVGITFSDATLAESGTVVLFSDNGKGRSVSLLPATYIAIVPKSTIVPRMTQVASEIQKQIKSGEKVASCVNFISGPSNSADIEMNLIVGVHGPIKATYIVVNDK